ncbi:MAG: membrane dipeptidase [Planctomycetota bacterium]|jgi:membrane dipeptidase
MPENPGNDHELRNKELIAARTVFDVHVDSLQCALDLGHDLGQRTSSQFDLVRAASGGLGSVVLVAWCDPVHGAPGGRGFRSRTNDLIDEFHALMARHPDQVGWAGNGQELARIHTEGRIAAVSGIEGGHSIEDSLEHLATFFERGVRLMTLVWNNHLSWIRSCQDGAGPDVPEGISDLGKRIVRRMNELGMLVDLSHAGRQSFFDVLEVSEKPPIASHSGCYALHDHPRNLDDEQLRELARVDGVVGMVFCVPFLDREARAEDNRLRETQEYRAIECESPAARFLAQGEFLLENAKPLPIDRVLDHALHVIEHAGVEHVGIGSDFDGIQRRPIGLEDASCYPHLAAGLRGRGLSVDEIGLVMGGNMQRAFATATAAGTRAAEVCSASAD